MKLYIIAGENSGDFIGSKLIQSLKLLASKDLVINGIGGDLMRSQGLDSLFPISNINLMGFFEILPHIIRIKKLINKTVEDIISHSPDVLITIDSPGFTYRVARRIKKLVPNIKLVHFVAPSVWAYKPFRAKKYAALYDHLLCLLPFEPKYFNKEGLGATFVGYPFFEQTFYKCTKELRVSMGIIDDSSKVIAVTPGSRLCEIKRHMPVIREVFDQLSSTWNIKVIFVQPDESNIQYILRYLDTAKFKFIFCTDRLKAFAVSDCALAKSGTNTLEIAASGTPMIIGYKLNSLTFFLLKMMIKVKYACLINIIADREIIPEYIQSDFNVDNLNLALSDLINDGKTRNIQVIESQKILKLIGLNSDQKPSEIAAKKIIEIANK